jgi:tetratricopeptide (TPR) repeat protein
MEQMARETMVLAQTHLGFESLPAADAQSVRAAALMVLRRIDEAERDVRQALALQRKLRGNDSVEEALALQCLSAVLRHQADRTDSATAQRQLVEAEESIREALAIFRKRLGDDGDRVTWALQELGMVLATAGRPDQAEDAVREAVMIRRRLHGDVHPYLASHYRLLGGVLCQQGKVEEAEEVLTKSLEIGQKMGVQGNNSELYTHVRLASVLAARGKLEEAETHRREAVMIARREMGADYPDLPNLLRALAETLQKNGKLADARTAAEEAVAICQRNPTLVPHAAQQAAFETLRGVLEDLGDTAALDALNAVLSPQYNQADNGTRKTLPSDSSPQSDDSPNPPASSSNSIPTTDD